MIKVWLTGGAIRDALLRRPVKDLDFIFSGGITSEKMNQLYGPPMGATFPVWRDGEVQVEIALPRKEVKVASGYQGFQVQVDPALPIEWELGRRDFTVNSLALLVAEVPQAPRGAELLKAAEAALVGLEPGKLVDPYGGLADLRQGILRSPNPGVFSEDPVRVLRAARFSARYGWRVESGTLEAARKAAPELALQPTERVWGEWEKACAHSPSTFLEVLAQAQALEHIQGLAWLARAFGMPQKGHGECLGTHTLWVVREVECLLPGNVGALTAGLFHDRGKANGLFPHDGEEAAVLVAQDLRALRAPAAVAKVATAWLRAHMKVWGLTRPGAILETASKLATAGLSPAEAAALAVADSQGREIRRSRPEAEARAQVVRRNLEAALAVIEEVRGNHPALEGVPPGPAFGEKLRSLRGSALAAKLKQK